MDPRSEPARTSPPRAAGGAPTGATPIADDAAFGARPFDGAQPGPDAGSAAGRESEMAPGGPPGRRGGVDAATLEAPDGGHRRRPAARRAQHAEREFVGTGWFWSLIIGSLLALAA